MHAAVLVSHLQQKLGQQFPLKKRRGAHYFLSAEALDVRAALAKARQECSRLKMHFRQQLLRVCFRMWRNADDAQAVAVLFRSPWYREAAVAGAWYSFQVATLAQRLRMLCQRDRAGYVANLTEQVDAGSAKVAYQATHRLLGHKRKKAFSVDVVASLRQK